MNSPLALACSINNRIGVSGRCQGEPAPAACLRMIPCYNLDGRANMKSAQIRQAFIDFFQERGHKLMPSSPLVLPWDPTVLFTTAGMQQFKRFFKGEAQPPARRLTSVQKCFRTSDIDKVGDASHLTFFEMLGNFSIGDYFKVEAINYAWELVIRVLGLPKERLWATVFLDDDEAFDLWRKQDVPAERIRRYGEEDNFWFSGDVGPCGPCSELHFDFGERFGCGPECEPSHDCGRFLEIWNLVFMTYFQHPDGSRTPLPTKNIDTGAGLERITAVMLFLGDWKNERPPSAYDTDLFAPIIKRIEELSGRRYGQDEATDRAMRIVAEHTRAATFLIGDERTPTLPSNEKQGSAVRRMIRKAVYYGHELFLSSPGSQQGQVVDLERALSAQEERRTQWESLVLMPLLAQTVIETMARVYPELHRQRDFILEALGQEEETFKDTLSRSSFIVETLFSVRQWLRHAHEVAGLRGQSWQQVFRNTLNQFPISSDAIKGILIQPILTRDEGQVSKLENELSGAEVFLLHDTYGFPMELTREIARERGFTIDEAGFEALMDEQRQRARAARERPVGGVVDSQEVIGIQRRRLSEQSRAARESQLQGSPRAGLESEGKTTDIAAPTTSFLGYETLRAETAVLTLIVGGQRAEMAQEGEAVEVILSETPFYPEGGGQVGDRGEVIGPHGRMRVEDTQRVAERLIVHRGHIIEGRIAVGDAVLAQVDEQHRLDTMRNHTGTHLLHAALRQVLGSHVRQSGSLVAPDRLRFDFTHGGSLSEDQLAEIQRLVNDKIRTNLPVAIRHTSFDQAISEGVLAFFGEAYGEEVRVVEVPEDSTRFSAELCGGTHCQRSGDIGLLLIVDESSIGAGLRRIEALTGRGAEEYVLQQQGALADLSRRLGAPAEALGAKLDALLTEQEALRQRIERLEMQLAKSMLESLVQQAVSVKDVTALTAKVEMASAEAVRYLGDLLRQRLGSVALVLGAAVDGRPYFVAMVTPDLVQRGLHAGEIVKRVAAVAGGSGGGRPDVGQGGGKEPAKLEEALAELPQIVDSMLTPA